MQPNISFIEIKDSILSKHRRKLYYTEWGNPNNDKILLCVHGLSRNSRDFDFLAKELSGFYRVICVDVVGRGNSDRFDNAKNYNYQNYVKDIKHLVDKLSIKKFDWLGTSMGGIMAILFDNQFPKLIDKIILNDIGPFITGKSLDRIIKYVSSTTEFDTLDEAHQALKVKLSTFGIKDPIHWDHMKEHSIEKIDTKFAYRYDPRIISKPQNDKKFDDIDLWPFWNKVNKNIMVLRGSLSDVLNKQTYQQMLESKENIEGIEFENIGHAPCLMNDYEIKPIYDWLKKNN